MRILHTSMAAILALSLAAPAFADGHEGPSADTVVATVNGTDITLGELIITRNQLPAQYQQLPDDMLFSGVLDQLIQQQLLADTMEATPSRVETALINNRRSLMAGEAITALVDAAVTDEAIEALYAETFLSGPAVTEWNASHILVETEEEALAAIARIEAGEEFAAVATELSQDPGSGANGGNLGWFGPGMMVAPFEEAVAATEVGAISAPVESQFGFHVITVLETREQEPPALENISDELAAQIQEQALTSELETLTEAAEIVMPEEGAFDPAILRDLTLLEE